MIPRPGALRVSLVANFVTALASGYLALVAGTGPRLGPARTDDLPYGNLLSLTRSGAIAWLVIALVGIVAAIMADRVVLAVSAGLWAAVSVAALVVVVAGGSFWGMSRPSDLAVTLGLTLAAAVAWLEVRTLPDAGV